MATTPTKKAKPRARATPKKRDTASLYPLDPETAIQAIMNAGPHPKDDKPANRLPQRKRQG
jgi:hypothetical protein